MAGKTRANDIDKYIASFPKDVKPYLEAMRKTIKSAAPGADEAMAYGIPTFKLNGRNLVHFAAFRSHIGFYPTPSAIVAFKKELAPYKQSKGSIQFPKGEPLPLSLVARIVKYRVAEENKGREK